MFARTDRHGLTPLHVAAMRNSTECIQVLLTAGATPQTKSVSGWIAVEEAFCYSSSRAVTVLLEEHHRLIGAKLKVQLAALKEVLTGMPDCAFQVRTTHFALLHRVPSRRVCCDCRCCHLPRTSFPFCHSRASRPSGKQARHTFRFRGSCHRRTWALSCTSTCQRTPTRCGSVAVASALTAT